MALMQRRLFAWTPPHCHKGLRPGVCLDVQIDQCGPVLDLQQDLFCKLDLLVLEQRIGRNAQG